MQRAKSIQPQTCKKLSFRFRQRYETRVFSNKTWMPSENIRFRVFSASLARQNGSFLFWARRRDSSVEGITIVYLEYNNTTHTLNTLTAPSPSPADNLNQLQA
jgi:hypothetical protein